MGENIGKFETIKGDKITLKAGIGRNPDRELQFVKNGVGVDISAFGVINAICKVKGKDDLSAGDNGFAEVVAAQVGGGTTGLINIAFQTGPITVNGKGEKLMLLISEAPNDTEHGEFEVDIVVANRD